MKFSQAIVLLLATLPALARAADDPWARVPALPTSCYTENDSFEGSAYAAIETLNSQEMQQQETNQAIEQQSRDVDIMEQQQRMVQFMMENPEETQRYMQLIQQTGQQVQEQAPEMAERQLQFDAELEDLKAAYDGALRQAMAPLAARRNQLNSSSGACDGAWLAKVAALSAEENQAYVRLCAGWWKTGPFHDWFARFRPFQIEVAAQQAEHSEANKLNYEMMGISAGEYQSTAHLRAPVEYLRRAISVYSKRRFGPVSEAPGRCSDGHG